MLCFHIVDGTVQRVQIRLLNGGHSKKPVVSYVRVSTWNFPISCPISNFRCRVVRKWGTLITHERQVLRKLRNADKTVATKTLWEYFAKFYPLFTGLKSF